MVSTEHLARLAAAAREGRREAHSRRRRQAACQHRARRHVRDVAADSRRGDLEGRAARQGRRAASRFRRDARGRISASAQDLRQDGRHRLDRQAGRRLTDMAARYTADLAATPDKRRFMFAYTNEDVATLNAHARALHRQRGDLGQDHSLATSIGAAQFATGDRIQFTGNGRRRPRRTQVSPMAASAPSPRSRSDEHARRACPSRSTRPKATSRRPSASLSARTARPGEFNSFKHGYAGTIYRGQGRTLDEALCLPFVALAQLRRLCRFDPAPRARSHIRGARDRQRP